MGKVVWTKELCLLTTFVFEVVYWVETPKAKFLETQLLQLGTAPKVNLKFGGYREMRIFTKNELSFAEDLLKQAGGV